MAKYIDAEKLKKEIENLKIDFIKFHTGIDSELVKSYLGYRSYDNVLSLIDSLQQEQTIKVGTLTWKDVNDLERIINNVHYEFRNGISAKSFGEEVLERFMEERDEQEHPEVDLEKEIDRAWEYLEKDYSSSALDKSVIIVSGLVGQKQFSQIAKYFFELGLNARKQ